MTLAGCHGERDVPQRRHCAKGLVDVLERDRFHR